MKEYQITDSFSKSNQSLFPLEFEVDKDVAFRAVRISEMCEVLKNGFVPRYLEGAISFAKTSIDRIKYVKSYIGETNDDVCVFVVRFKTSDDERISHTPAPYLHIFRTDKRPEILQTILGYCIMSKNNDQLGF